jgi:hypothetical protein
MSRDDVFQVRHQSIPAVGESNRELGILNNFGAQVVVDLVTQWLLSGFCFHMQAGTEDAPITTQGPLDDTKPFILADNNSGVIVPLLYEVGVSAHLTSTAIEAMLEIDMDKKRFSAGTTIYVPEQMNNAATGAAAANGTFYVTDGGDITALAKSAVPASIELARKTLSEDAIGNPAGAQFALDKIFSIRERLPAIGITPSSICAHFGSATADVTGYATLDFAQFASGLAW